VGGTAARLWATVEEGRYFAIRRFARFWAIVVNTALSWDAFWTL
jgi:hypothetical protein